ncbi:hypothetical protein P3339_09190 [Microbulbifer sp. MLAF003]|uniref:hypothetical protein n=1 Tax=Microbulbifer TaxID=48073 RepID=UPI00037459E1|nr:MULTISPECIES: hypothetical protein [Microbulbifer]WHI52915.1 hypothetical protein P3339_09190 [Microbulbifer sp. MLAF003]
MKKVYLYGFNGTYSGESKYNWSPPEKGDSHDCLLFLRQTEDAVNFEAATLEIANFGFVGVSDLKGNSLKVEALNSDLHRGFRGFYESALHDGSCLVFYPNT